MSAEATTKAEVLRELIADTQERLARPYGMPRFERLGLQSRLEWLNRQLEETGWNYVGQASGKDGVWHTITSTCVTSGEALGQLNPSAVTDGVARVARIRPAARGSAAPVTGCVSGYPTQAPA